MSPDSKKEQEHKGKKMDDGVQNGVMVVLTFIFVALYCASLFGWLKPLTDDRMVSRIEPIVFAIIGYYFGRLPGDQNEKRLQNSIDQEKEKSTREQGLKEEAQQEASALHAKVNATTAILTDEPSGGGARGMAPNLSGSSSSTSSGELRSVVSLALKVLRSDYRSK